MPVGRSQSPLQCSRPGFSLNRKLLLGLAVAALIAGVAFSWSWFVAAGAVPLLLGILPCAVMCVLGSCSKKRGTSDSPAADRPQGETP
jgi:hypothetical protein